MIKQKVDSAKIYIDKALELDNNLYAAYNALAVIHFRECNYPDALSALNKSKTLNPGDEWAHIFHARFLFYLGRYNEALREAHIAMELNPLDASPYALAIAINNNLDRYDDALAIYRKANELIPDNLYIHRHLGRLYYRRGEYDKALEALQKVNDIPPIGVTYALMGEREKAVQVLRELEAGSKDDYLLYIPALYIALGDHEKALDLLEHTIINENKQLQTLYCDFEFDPVRDNPRFKALVKKMGLPED